MYRNVRPKLSSVRAVNKVLGTSILADIESLQWAAQSENEFTILCHHLRKHYLEQRLIPTEMVPVRTFFDYFLNQWGPGSHVMNWFAGSNPFNITNNQGLEGTHKEMKKNHTFRSELPIGQFFRVTKRLVSMKYL